MSHESTYYNRKYKDSLFRFIFNSKVAVLREKISDKLLTSLILSYHAQNKSPEEIAALCEQSIDFVLDVLKKHNL